MICDDSLDSHQNLWILIFTHSSMWSITLPTQNYFFIKVRAPIRRSFWRKWQVERNYLVEIPGKHHFKKNCETARSKRYLELSRNQLHLHTGFLTEHFRVRKKMILSTSDDSVIRKREVLFFWFLPGQIKKRNVVESRGHNVSQGCSRPLTKNQTKG